MLRHDDAQITVRMHRTDDISPTPQTPKQFRYGRTDITMMITLTLRKKRSDIEYKVTLMNNRNQPVEYEYWQAMMLAPGSHRYWTTAMHDTRLVLPIDKVWLQDERWPWMMNSEEKVFPGDPDFAHVYDYRNLASFKNWQDLGFAYAYPRVTETWYGVITGEGKAAHGIFRIADNANITRGLQIRTWGFDSLGVDPRNANIPDRPYIELWAGLSDRFYQPMRLAPYEVKEWIEYFVPMVGLDDVKAASQAGSINLASEYIADEDALQIKTQFFATRPYKPVIVSIHLVETDTGEIIHQMQREFIAKPKGNQWHVQLPVHIMLEMDPVDYRIKAVAKDLYGIRIMDAEIHYRHQPVYHAEKVKNGTKY